MEAIDGKRKRQTLQGPEEAMTLLSGGDDCDNDEVKYDEAGDAAPAPVKRMCPPLTAEDTPLPAQPQATLPPPPLWMIRNSATGKTWGPFLISTLRRGVAEGRISAKDMLAWRQDEGETAAVSLQAALDLPRIPSRSQQTKRMRTVD